MATLKLELGTPKGDAQREAIEWAEQQMNGVMAQLFNNQYKLIKGIQFKFDFGALLAVESPVQVKIATLEPTSQEKAETAMKEAIEGLHLKTEKTDEQPKK